MLRSINLSTELQRFARFSVVGILNLFLYTGITLAAIEGLALSPVVASLIGQVASVVVLYLGHFSYSFGLEPNHRVFLWRFVAAVMVLMATNVGLTWLLTGVLEVPHRISIAVLALLIPLMSYLLNRFWVFASGLQGPAALRRTENVGVEGER